MYLRYVGKKPFAIDSVGGTGVLWNGHGDIQEVPNTVGEKLLAYPDQWEEAVPKKTADKAPAPAKAPAKGGKKPQATDVKPLEPIEPVEPVPPIDPEEPFEE